MNKIHNYQKWLFKYLQYIAVSSRLHSEHRELYNNMGMRIEYTIFLMMRLKSFRPDIDKKIGSPGENAKNKKKSLQ